MELKLPLELLTLKELIQVQGELSKLIDAIIQKNLSHQDNIQINPSVALKALAMSNQINLSQEQDCRKLLANLKQLIDKAPEITLGFAGEPSNEVLQRLMAWFRKEISPTTLLKVSIRPSIGVGMVLQTPLHRYDFSLRRHLLNHRQDFINVLKSNVADSL